MTVYPDDVKAIISQLWAETEIPVSFVGGRCNDKNPATDGNGRIISDKCFDTNPASWHIVLLNLVGKQKRSFVFDATYDFEVWNQPISSYEVKYFNPSNKKLSNDLNDSLISYSNFRNDPFKKYRHSMTDSIVGVQLDLRYVVETLPRQVNGVSSSTPNVVRVTYYYDLEIDRDGNVIGGEWYQVAHPDMLWKPNINRPITKYDSDFKNWDGSFPLPVDLIDIANKNSAYGQPTNEIVDQLVKWSQF
jgi:hypothetical protein